MTWKLRFCFLAAAILDISITHNPIKTAQIGTKIIPINTER